MGIWLTKRSKKRIEQQVTQYLQKNLSFVVVSAPDKDVRLHLEARIVSTVFIVFSMPLIP